MDGAEINKKDHVCCLHETQTNEQQSRGFCVNSLLLFWAAIQTCRLYFRWWDRDMENAAIKLKGMAGDEVYTAVLRWLRLSRLVVPRDTFTSSRRRFMEVSTIFINRHASLCVRSVICRRRWLSVSQSALCDENWCQTLTFHLYFSATADGPRDALCQSKSRWL